MAVLPAMLDGGTRMRLGSGWLLVAAALAVFSLGCENEDFDEQDEPLVTTETSEIMNGSLYEVDPNWRGVVRLEIWSYSWDTWQDCTGQVVSRRSILTAAHCVLFGLGEGNSSYSNPGQFIIRAWRPTGQGTEVSVMPGPWVTGEFNPDFTKYNMSKYDVGVLTATSDLINITSLDRAKLAMQHDLGWNRKYAFGFGFHDEGELDNLGRSAEVVTLYQPITGKYGYWADSASDPYMCGGDSGGPLKDGTAALFNPSTVHGVFSKRVPRSLQCAPEAYWATTADNMYWLRDHIYGNCQDYNDEYFYCR